MRPVRISVEDFVDCLSSVRVVDAKKLITPFVRARLEIKLGTKFSQFEMFMKFTITGFVFVALLSLD